MLTGSGWRGRVLAAALAGISVGAQAGSLNFDTGFGNGGFAGSPYAGGYQKSLVGIDSAGRTLFVDPAVGAGAPGRSGACARCV